MGAFKKSDGPFYSIGIDLGTSGPKVAVVEDTGKVLAVQRGNTDMLSHRPTMAEQDTGQWWSEIKRTFKSVVKESGVSKEKIVAIGTCSTYCNTVPVDEHGEPLMNSLMWMDSRGAGYNASIMKGFPMIQGYGLGKMLKMLKRVGVPPLLSGIDCVGHMGVIKTQHPDIYKKTYKFLEPMDFITSKLTGKITTTQGNTFGSMVVDNRKWSNTRYDDELTKIIGIDKEKFPELLPNNAVIGNLTSSMAEELGLSKQTQVVAGSNDNITGALGAGVADDSDIAIIVGTSLFMTGFVPFKKTDLKHLILTIPAPIRDRYCIMGVQGAGGKNMELFLEKLIFGDDLFGQWPLPDDAYEVVDKLAAEAPAGSNGAMFLPWVTGTIVPSESPYSKATLINLGMDTKRSHICRAVVEGIALQNLWTKAPMEKFIGKKIESFRLSGGGARLKIFGQVMADVLGVPVHATEDPLSVSARGAGLNAFMAVDHLKKEEISGLVKIKNSYDPNPEHRWLYDMMLEQFISLHKTTKPVFTALNSGKAA